MKEKDLIKLYFENYYPNNKKYVYKEDFGIGSIIFLFLLLLMITTFSKSNSNQISKKINNDPEIPKEIIKNLEIIKNILIKDNPNKNLDDIMNLLDNLNKPDFIREDEAFQALLQYLIITGDYT